MVFEFQIISNNFDRLLGDTWQDCEGNEHANEAKHAFRVNEMQRVLKVFSIHNNKPVLTACCTANWKRNYPSTSYG
jgi:hypothetical protein